ncbi:MAG TPA: hypothetical protein VK525_19305 [Candidatus Saccharimonadales bacterium]|nr:hypothetical protein [Candidatus Saccharimonadales bacterium]
MRLKYIAAGLIAVGCLTAVAEGQKSFWDSPQAYLGQTRPSDTPQIFARDLLTEPGTIAMDHIAFSRDGREIYYLQSDRWGSLANAKIKAFRYDGHRWAGPTVLNEHLFAVVMAPDDSEMYFEDDDPKHVWRSERTKDGWTVPVVAYEEPFGMYGFTPTKSGTIYISSESDAEDRKAGITNSFSTLNISAAGPQVKSLGVPLNELGVNSDFFIAPDESYMIVSAKETKTFECELYISFRRSDSTWTTSVSLGPKINDGLAHRWAAYVTPDGKYLFYTRGTSAKDSAIYWVRFDKLLGRLRPKQ